MTTAEAQNYIKELPFELAGIAEATQRAKLSWDRGGMGVEEMGKVYDALVTANTLAILLLRNFPLELLRERGQGVKVNQNQEKGGKE